MWKRELSSESLDWLENAKVHAMMFWPDEPEQQLNTVATLMKAVFVGLQEDGKALNDPDIWPALDYIIRDIGGWSAIAESPEVKSVDEKIHARRLQAEVAGHILLLLVGWSSEPSGKRGGPSVRKTIHMLEEDGKIGQFWKLTHDQMMGAWIRFKSVAHLWGAVSAVHALHEINRTRMREAGHSVPEGTRSAPYSLDDWMKVYGYAERLRKFGTSYVPDRGKRPLLDPEGTVAITVPESWGADIPLPEFPRHLLGHLKSYRT